MLSDPLTFSITFYTIDSTAFVRHPSTPLSWYGTEARIIMFPASLPGFPVATASCFYFT
jgi:hypothetical protein